MQHFFKDFDSIYELFSVHYKNVASHFNTNILNILTNVFLFLILEFIDDYLASSVIDFRQAYQHIYKVPSCLNIYIETKEFYRLWCVQYAFAQL